MTMTSPANLQRTLPTPIHRQVAAYLRRQIDTGQWPPHFKLPGEIDLAQQISVSRTTLRRAIKDLTAQGKLVSLHGRGTFVASPALEQPLADSLVAFSEELRRRGIAFETRLLSAAVIAPPARVSSLLGLKPRERVFALRRVRLVRGAPIIYLENYVAARHCPGIERVDFCQRGLFETLENTFGLSLDWGQRSFQAQVADAALADNLQLEPGAAVMYLEQLVYLASGLPIELSDVWLCGDRFRLSAIVKRYRNGPLPPSALEMY
ncbi:MAG: GntR family transcriptional regulator [Anaerolineales bacterium]